ncbi:DUF397 domain-containing protein [Spirillospora sp. NPDC049024]
MITWHKSTPSDEVGGRCVEVAALTHAIAIRDSKAHRERPPRPHPYAFTDLAIHAKQGSLMR